MVFVRRGATVQIYRPTQQDENGTTLLRQAFSSNGTGGGTTNMTVDASVTPQRFWIEPPAGEVYYIKQIRFHLEDAVIANVNNWGGITSHVSGETLVVEDSADQPIYDITSATTGTSGNRSFARHSRWIEIASDWHIAGANTGWPNGNYRFFATIDFPELCGGLLRLDGNLGEKIVYTLRDRCDQVDTHRLEAHGWIEQLNTP